MIRRYLERNNEIKFNTDYIDGVKITRMVCTSLFWRNKMNYIEWVLLGFLDRLSGFYGFRITIKGGN